MAILLRFALRLAGVVVFAMLARAIILAANLAGYNPERWLAEMFVTAATGTVLEIAAWGLAGIIGVVGLVAWEWLKIGNRLARLLPQTHKKKQDMMTEDEENIYIHKGHTSTIIETLRKHGRKFRGFRKSE